jgi:hypothetical protein
MPRSVAHKKTRKRSKSKKKRTIKKKRTGKMNGGWSFFTRQSKEITEPNKSCPYLDLSCNWLDTHYTKPSRINETWHTCIKMNDIINRVIYITSRNVLIKSIESFQIPEFNVTLSSNVGPEKCNIMIEDKFVGCFLNVCGEWYVIMRLFGKTLNTGVLARTEANKAYYKISNIQINARVPNSGEAGSGQVVGDSSITIAENYYTIVDSSFRLKTSKSHVIRLNPDCFENINKTNSVFNVLQRFRQQKLFANSEKQNIAYDILSDVAKNISE